MSDWVLAKDQPETKNPSSDWVLADDQPESSSLENIVKKTLGRKTIPAGLFDTVLGVIPGYNQMKTIEEATGNQFLNRPLEKLSSDALKTGENILGSVTKGTPALLNQLFSEPGKAIKNIAAGVGGIPFNAANMVIDLPSYIASLGSEKAGDFLNQYTPQIPVEKYQEKFVGGIQNESDKAVRELAANLPILFPFGKASTKGAVSAGKAIASKVIGKSNRLVEENELNLQLLKEKKQDELEKLMDEHEKNVDIYNEAVNQAKEKVNMSDSARMKYRLNEQNNKILQLKDEHNQLDQALNSLSKPSLKISEMELENQKKNIFNAETQHETAKNLSNELESALSEHLEQGSAHDVRVAQTVKKVINSLFKEGNQKFEALKGDLSDKNIIINNTDKVKELNNNIVKLIQESGGMEKNTKAIQALGDQILKAGSQEIIPANDYVQAYQTVNGYMRKAYEKAYKPGLLKDEQAEWKKRGDEAKEKLKEMESVLKENIGEDDFNNLLDAKSYWKNNIVPLYKNPVYHKIMNEERMSQTDMIGSMRGNVSGMDIIKNIIKSDPQALKHVIGQRYEKISPSKIYNPNELTREYLAHVPDIQKMIENRNEALRMINTSKSHIKQAKENYSNAQNISTENKSYEKNKKDLEEKINSHESKIKEIENENILLEKHMNELKEKSKKKNISLKSMFSLKKEIASINKKIVENRKELEKSSTGLRKLYLIAKTLYRIGKKVT